MQDTYTIEVYGGRFIVTVNGDTAELTTEGMKDVSPKADAVIDGIGILVLGLAQQGFDLNDPRFRQAVKTATDAVLHPL
jgi:hypothetical protein